MQTAPAYGSLFGDVAESVRSMMDVEPSYAVAAAMVLGLVPGSTRGRVAWGV